MASIALPIVVPNPSSLCDADLVRSVRAGSRAAGTELYLRYVRLGRGLAVKRAGTRCDVDDVVQDCFVEALKTLDQLKNPQAFASWFASLVVRRVSKNLRHAHYRSRITPPRSTSWIDENTVGPSATPEALMDLARFLDLMRADTSENQALLLHLEGWSLPEVARKLRTSLSSVKRRLVSARARTAAFPSATPVPPSSQTL